MSARPTSSPRSESVDRGDEAWEYATTADLDRAPLQVAISPMPTLLTVLRDALQHGRRGTPAEWRTAVVSRLRGRDAAILAPLADPAVTTYPALLEPVDTRAAREPVAVALERVSAAGGGAVVDALDHARDVSPARGWELVKRAPERWLAGYVDALHRCWPAVEPLWHRSLALLEREEDRLHAAMERGVAPTQAFAGVSSRLAVVGERLRIAPAEGESRRLRIDEHGATVVPMAVSSQAGTLSAPGEYLDWIGYPLPDGWRAFDDSAPPRASLQALLGVQRAALLRGLDRPQTAGRLAQLLDCAPSVITYHLRALEAAGLASRLRHGRHVMVQRSSRGRALLDLYE
jgi:DNA-binding transcriptional ArsR family regulator